MPSPGPSLPSPFGGPQERLLLARLLILSIAVMGLLRWAELAKSHLSFPMDLGIETPNRIAADDIRSGRGVYFKANMEGPPFHILSYTPLFHALTAALPSAEGNPFFTGRLLSGLCGLGAVCLFGFTGRRYSWTACLLGAAAFILVDFVSLNAFIFESASLGLLLSLGAVACLSRKGLAPAAAAAALCWLSFMAKQNYAAAAGAVGLHLLLTDRRRAAVFAPLYAGLVGGSLWLLTVKYGEGFWISTFGFLGAPFSLGTLLGFLGQAFRDPLFSGLALGTAALWVRAARLSPAGAWKGSPRALYLASSLGVAFMGLRAKGGGPNYLSEPLAAALLLSAELADREGVFPARAGLPLLAAFFALAAYKVRCLPPLQYSQLSPSVRADYLGRKDVIAREVASLGLEDPTVLNLVDSPSGLLLSPRVLMSDMYHFSSLWERGVVSMDPLLASLDRKAYDVVALPSWVAADKPSRRAHLDPLRVRLFANYSVEREGAYFNYLRPRRGRG